MSAAEEQVSDLAEPAPDRDLRVISADIPTEEIIVAESRVLDQQFRGGEHDRSSHESSGQSDTICQCNNMHLGYPIIPFYRAIRWTAETIIIAGS